MDKTEPKIIYSLFNQDAVKGLRDGTQTQMRRRINPQPTLDIAEGHGYNACGIIDGYYVFRTALGYSNLVESLYYKPKYQPGDIIGVRERAKVAELTGHKIPWARFSYQADYALTDLIKWPDRIKPVKLGHCVPNGCFKELVRMFLKVTKVRVERIQDISQKDIIREGVDISCNYGMNIDHVVDGCDCVKPRFISLWNSIYPGSWERNDWCFAYNFEECEKP